MHVHSAILENNRLCLAVGNFVACLNLPSLALAWAVEADTATCFGLYPIAEGIICRGELEITRLSWTGEIVWQRSGRDIFTGPFALEPHWIAARDWNGSQYRIAYDGRVLEAPAR